MGKQGVAAKDTLARLGEAPGPGGGGGGSPGADAGGGRGADPAERTAAALGGLSALGLCMDIRHDRKGFRVRVHRVLTAAEMMLFASARTLRAGILTGKITL